MPSTSLLASKNLLIEFAERYIFRKGEQVKPFWGKRVYVPIPPNTPTTTQQQHDTKDKDFEEWHTALQYVEMIDLVAGGRRSSVGHYE